MEKQDLVKFVGIPFKFLGTDYDGVDCIGLCQLFYKEHGVNIEFRDGRPIDKQWYLKEPFRLARWLLKNFVKIEDFNQFQYGDVVLFEINGESHTGIYIGRNKVLTILEFYNRSMITRINQNNMYLRCGFRKVVCDGS